MSRLFFSLPSAACAVFVQALYELPDDEVTAERIVALADEIENSIEGGPAPRPLMRWGQGWGGRWAVGP